MPLLSPKCIKNKSNGNNNIEDRLSETWPTRSSRTKSTKKQVQRTREHRRRGWRNAAPCVFSGPLGCAVELDESLGANKFESVHRPAFVSDDRPYFSARGHFELNPFPNIQFSPHRGR